VSLGVQTLYNGAQRTPIGLTTTMPATPLPQTSMPQVSRLGFGASGAWGKKWFSERKAGALIARALESGIVQFDTAGFYANGIAEARLGAALKLTSRDNIQISSKTGKRYGFLGRPSKDFSAGAIRADVHASLKRLGRDRIDTLYLHGPSPAQIDGTRNVMAMLKQEGKIGAIGVCGVGEQLDHAIKSKAADTIMGLYNAFDQRHADIFAHAKANKVTTVAIAPLGQALYQPGFLIPKSPSDIWYLARALGRNGPELKHARQIAANVLGGVEGRTRAGAMLGFALANPDLDVVLTNTTRLHHLDESIATAAGPALDERTVSILAKLERNHN